MSLVLWIALSATAHAAEPPAAVVSCPDSLAVPQVAKEPSPEWSVSYSSAPVDLEAVTLFDGPPEDKASLVYDDKSEAGEEWTATWKLAANPRGIGFAVPIGERPRC